MINRNIIQSIKEKFYSGKAIILLGARQVGKSTLLRELIKDETNVLWLDAENADVDALFEQVTSVRLKTLFGKHKIVVIDEAQKINNIGSVLKLAVDYHPHIQVIATGSSSFELRNKTDESLTGRKWEFQLFPFSFAELVDHADLLTEKRMLPHRLVYGSYPEMVIHNDDLEKRIRSLTDSYLYKDVLMWNDIKKPDKLHALIKALAFQIGSEVNYHELGNRIGLKNETVEKYIQVLEQAFIIFRLPAYSTNQRKELKKGKKLYFVDNGIRNAVIGDFKTWESRQDQGVLFENFIISEYWKKEKYIGEYASFYFWRTQDQQEIDLVIHKKDMLHAFEIKLNAKAKAKLSKTFSGLYPQHTFDVIHQGNYDEYLLS